MDGDCGQNPADSEENDNIRKIRLRLSNLFGIIFNSRQKISKLCMYYSRRRFNVVQKRREIEILIDEIKQFAIDYNELEERTNEQLDRLQYEEILAKCNQIFAEVFRFNLSITERFNRDLQEIDEILQEMHDDKHLNRRPQ